MKCSAGEHQLIWLTPLQRAKRDWGRCWSHFFDKKNPQPLLYLLLLLFHGIHPRMSWASFHVSTLLLPLSLPWDELTFIICQDALGIIISATDFRCSIASSLPSLPLAIVKASTQWLKKSMWSEQTVKVGSQVTVRLVQPGTWRILKPKSVKNRAFWWVSTLFHQPLELLELNKFVDNLFSHWSAELTANSWNFAPLHSPWTCQLPTSLLRLLSLYSNTSQLEITSCWHTQYCFFRIPLVSETVWLQVLNH